MTPEEIEIARAELSGFGMEVHPEEFTFLTMEHDLAAMPHQFIGLYRIETLVHSGVMPAEHVHAVASCIFCKAWLVAGPVDCDAVRQGGVPICLECGPRGDMRDALIRSGKPTAEFIRELLRQGN